MDFNTQKFVDWAKDYTDYNTLVIKGKKAFEGWDIREPNLFFNDFRELTDFAEELVDLVEKFAKDTDNLSSKEKLDIVADFIDDAIRVGVMLEWADRLVINAILSSAVQYKNKWFGKNWMND